MARAAGALATAAMAEALDQRLALGPVAQRPAGASTRPLTRRHRTTMTWRPQRRTAQPTDAEDQEATISRLTTLNSTLMPKAGA